LLQKTSLGFKRVRGVAYLWVNLASQITRVIKGSVCGEGGGQRGGGGGGKAKGNQSPRTVWQNAGEGTTLRIKEVGKKVVGYGLQILILKLVCNVEGRLQGGRGLTATSRWGGVAFKQGVSDIRGWFLGSLGSQIPEKKGQTTPRHASLHLDSGGRGA